MKTKLNLVLALVVAIFTLAFVGCSKDDDPSTGGSIDAAVGTFKGTIQIPGEDKMFDKVLVVTKVSDGVLRAKVQDESLGLPVKEFSVINNMDISIQTSGVSPEGSFLYDVKNRTLLCQGEETNEGDIFYTFEGSKQ
ncbi:hypothetical protein [Sphingobacterium suaedae]|uniref:Uncharacterized protein n=1 Tax=Sphingobacterium suaedae TaxID=1686402 RepID=A0ABW5KB19_9SPHI